MLILDHQILLRLIYFVKCILHNSYYFKISFVQYGSSGGLINFVSPKMLKKDPNFTYFEVFSMFR